MFMLAIGRRAVNYEEKILYLCASPTMLSMLSNTILPGQFDANRSDVPLLAVRVEII